MGLPKEWQEKLYAKWPSGPQNKITDVAGVTVGHVTLQDGEIQTGVTAILPHQANVFMDKVLAGATVINGFGKTAGLVQVEELGTIETPIVMTNTLSVGTAYTALVRYSLEHNEDIGVTTGSVNPLVTECNDGRLNDIRGLHVKEEHVFQAIKHADTDFEEGAIGSGTGMVCLGFKGGIGSASRVVTLDDKKYTIGALVMTNFGAKGNLVIGGDHIGRRILEKQKEVELGTHLPGEKNQESTGKKDSDEKDQGSIIIIIATDLPLNERQLKRVSKRSMASLGRVGSYCGNGSGDIAIAFSTSNRIPHYSTCAILNTKMVCDDELDCVFEATVESVEEAIISSLYHAKTTIGVRGYTVQSLGDAMKQGEV